MMNFLELAIQNARTEFPAKRELVTVCAWCVDSHEQTVSARAHGFDVSHSLCAACVARMNAEMDR